ncbi:HDIG domain-containing protein [Maribellus comscasis]|uniref:HDIG domain-containing protein n=1 Tax=Maribellus comscasis TaxID=2681766 RepID=A0A6I6K350_9BACT|nr:HDIG domain-containing metalloprotein [Maribellus comscasis]QGY46822.1 HDIG domain-containing protein [Maribellus comscasis]
MSKFHERLMKYTRVLYWLFVFLIAAVLLFLILPGEPKFKYEYQKGFPWRHDNLVAPFDFAISKTPKEIEDEKAEQLKAVVPYFSFDTAVVNQKINELRTSFNPTGDSIQDEKEEVFQILSDKLKTIYTNGILQHSSASYDELLGKTEIRKRTGTLVSKISTDKVYSEKTAYNEFYNEIENIKERYPELNEWLSDIIIENYITTNLIYDATTTQKEIDEITQNISPTRGMVQMGERIILQGEIVTGEKYQILESLKASYEKERGKGFDRYTVSVGKIILILSLLGLIFTFLYIYRRDTLDGFRRLLFLILFMVSMVFLASFFNSFPNLHIYLVPLAIFPIVVRTFFDSRTAIFMLIITTLLIGFYAPNNYEFILLQVTAGVVAVFSLNKMHRRVHLVMATIWVFLTYLLVYSALNLIHEGTFIAYNYQMLQWFALSSLLILLVYPLIYIFEKLFGFISDVTLIELSDSNQPLLRKLAEEAPGTFQHSMQIANLAEEVILKIGGNPFLVRAGSLYHDIGKIAKPTFFIENQAVGMNPHDRMDYKQSAEIIIDHVRNGVRMAKKHKLPESLVEFIATHHGTTKAKYFYLKHQQEHPDEKVDEDTFIYPGPLPISKEAAVVMLVDGIEAASRSLKEKTLENLRGLINNMIDQKIADKQLDHSKLTFNDINIIKATLLEKLINIYHIRIEYPKEEEKKA